MYKSICSVTEAGFIPEQKDNYYLLIIKQGKPEMEGCSGMLVFGYAFTASTDAMWANTPVSQIIAASFGAGVEALGGYLAGRAAGSPGETIYISKEAAMAEAK